MKNFVSLARFTGCAFAFCLSTQAFALVEGGISGSVLDVQQVAIPHAKVQLQDKTGKVLKETESSDTGTYSFFPIMPGDYQVSVAAPGMAPSVSEVHVATGGTTIADAQLNSATPSGQEMVVEVTAKKHLIQNSASVSRTEVNQEQIRQLPQGSQISLPKLITSTSPGVVGGPFGQMFIRGNHANIQYQIDGVQLPDSPSNTFGQAFSPRNIDTMEVITGGTPAEYGLRLSGVMNIVTKTGPEKPSGEIELNYGSYNTFSPQIMYGGSNEAGDVHYFVSGNFFRTDRGLDTPNPESVENQAQGGSDSVHNSANGNSEFAKVDWQVDNSNKLSFIFFNSYSFYQIPNYPWSFSPSSDFFQPGYSDPFGNGGDAGSTTYNFVPYNTNDTQSETNSFGQVVWKHSFSEKSFLQVAPYYKYSQIVVTNDQANDLYTASLANGGTFPIEGAHPSSFAMNRHVNNLGLKTDYSWRANDSHLIKTGFQLQGSQASGSYSVIGIDHDGDLVSFSSSDPTTGYFESVYLQDDYTIFKRLILNAGLRFDATQFNFSGIHPTDSMLQPRIGLNYLVTDTTKIHGFYGKLFQPAPVENLRAAFSIYNNTAAPYDIKAEKDDYFEVGVAQQFMGNHVAQLNVYYKDAVNMLDDAQLLNTSIAQPYNFATGYAYGAELSLKGKLTQDWSYYGNYSYEIAMGKGISGGIWALGPPEEAQEEASAPYQYLDHVQVHTANAGLTYAKNHFWGTAQGLYGSGLRTGPNNGLSLPSHFTMDTTLGYEFHGDSWWAQWRVSGDVLNVLDNKYPITIANGYNGSHYAAGRQYFLRLSKSL